MSNSPVKFIGVTAQSVGQLGLKQAMFNAQNDRSLSNNAFARARAMRLQRIQDGLSPRTRRGRGAVDSLFNRGARAERTRQRMLAAGAAPSIAEGDIGTSQVSGIMEGAQASGGLIGAASSAAAAQQPIASETLAPADRKAAFDAGIGTINPMAGMTVFGANQGKLDAINSTSFEKYITFVDFCTAQDRAIKEQTRKYNALKAGLTPRTMASSVDDAFAQSGGTLNYEARQTPTRDFDYSTLGYQMSNNQNFARLFAGNTAALYFKKQKTK